MGKVPRPLQRRIRSCGSSGGGLGCSATRRVFQSRRWEAATRGACGISGWPLHRSVHAGSRYGNRLERCLDWRRLKLRLRALAARCGRQVLPSAPGAVMTAPGRSGRYGECARALVWLQKSARGAWFREAVSGSLGAGDGCLGRIGFAGSLETASRTVARGNAGNREGSEEDHSLAKGVLGRKRQ